MTEAFDFAALKRRLLPYSSVLESVKSEQPVAAVAIVINPNDRGGSILLIKRTERTGDPWSGQVAFPGGHRSSGDRTFLETAVREAREEIGISLIEHEMLGVLPLVHARGRHIAVAPFVFQLKKEVEIQPSIEVAEFFWMPLAELDHLPSSKSDVTVEEGKLTVDSYKYRGHIIWGMTFRVIDLLLDKNTFDDV